MITGKFYFKLKERAVLFFYQKARILFYSFISPIKISGVKKQPVLSNGKGKINISESVTFGVRDSAFFYSGYSYIESRTKESIIEIGDNCFINNNANIVSDGKKIIIKNNCLIGLNLQIIDSDFHELNPNRRFGGVDIARKNVTINENVFIGNNVTILKGVNVGKNSVIGNGSVVTKSVPDNSIVAGNPAKIIKSL